MTGVSAYSQRPSARETEALVMRHAELVKRIAYHLAGRLPASTPLMYSRSMLPSNVIATCDQPFKGTDRFDTKPTGPLDRNTIGTTVPSARSVSHVAGVHHRLRS